MTLPETLGGDRRRLLAQLVANGAAQAVAVAATAWLARDVFERWILDRPAAVDVGAMALWPALAACYLALAGLRLRERVQAERLGQSYVHAVRLALYDCLRRLPPRVIQARSRGGHLLRFIGDLTAMRQWVSLGLARLLVAGVSLILTLAILAAIAPPVAAAVAALLVAAGALSGVVGGRVRGATAEARRRRARLATNVDEKISAMATVQVHGQTRRERRRLSRQSARLAQAMIRRATAVGMLRAVADLANGCATLAVLLAGAVGLVLGHASPGAVIAGMAVLGLCLPMVRDLARVHEHWQGYRVARGSVESFVRGAAPARLRGGAGRLGAGRAAVTLRGISVAGALEDVSVHAPAGSVVAVVGPNGAGKSTLLGLVARLLDPDSGDVLIDGTRVKDLRLSSLRRTVSMVGPDLPLLRGSLERNVRYRRRRASARSVARVCARCGVDEVAARLPRGLATPVADAGVNLSAGERTRVALARALLGRPGVLLLDEADAHLDRRGAARLDSVIDAYDGTVIMITHDPARAVGADLVWHLEGGRLVAAGPPAELARLDSPTSRLLDGYRLEAVA